MMVRKEVTLIIVLLFSITLFQPTAIARSGITEPIQQDTTVSQTFTSANVLVDESHCDGTSEIWVPGNASMFGWILMKEGYNVSNNWNEPLDSGILDNYDVLALFFPQVEFTSGEVTAIHDFVDNGGGLLLVGVDTNPSGWNYTVDNLNTISEPYGVTFNSERLFGQAARDSGDIVEHAITQDVSSLSIHSSAIWGCSLNVESPAISLATRSESPILAYNDDGNGRVVAVGYSGPFLEYRHFPHEQVESDDHFQFSLNVIDWLTGNSPRKVDAEGTAVITVGPGPDLNSTEIEEYQMFDGAYHDHTTVSDGDNSPLEMLTRAVDISMDYFVISDHAYETPGQNGILGALRAEGFKDRFGLDINIIVGAEISRTPHMVGFPMTENIFTTDSQYAVDEIHNQGGIVVQSHATLSRNHANGWAFFDEWGLDVFEVNNDAYFLGEGEGAYYRPFIGASDGHSARDLGNMRNTVFVKDPTGPNGTISDQDLVDAILNRRIVCTDKLNDWVFGQEVWVNRYLEIQDEAEAAIADATEMIEELEGEGENLGLSRLYLARAESAFADWNQARALEYASDAVDSFSLGLDVDLEQITIGVNDPNDLVNIPITITNNHSFAVALNCTPYISVGLTIDQPFQIIEIGPESEHTTTFTATTSDFGYNRISFYLSAFNSTEKLLPVTFVMGGFIDTTDSETIDEDDGKTVRVWFLTGSLDINYLSFVQLHYDDGTTEDTVDMPFEYTEYSVNLGPYTSSANITYQIEIVDRIGNVFTIDGSHQIVIADPTTTPDNSFIYLAITGVIGAVLVVMIVVMMIRKRGS
ncbi:MAG: hypothetical protein ACXADL_00310 [Candidatus Thorarchaeota archaeon]|jgi:hypothetical protein